MDRKRKVYAPFSQTSEAGVTQTPVEGYIDVSQMIYPTVSTGVVNEKGQWTGVKSSDSDFFDITKHVGVANGGETLSPDTGTSNFIDMTGFTDMFLAIKPTRGGALAISAVMGPDTNRFANLSPVASGQSLRGLKRNDSSASISNLLVDTSDTVYADVWNIFVIQSVLQDQKLLQLKIVNNTGGSADLEVAFMRMV